MEKIILNEEYIRMQKLAGINHNEDKKIIKLINEAYLMNEGWWENAKYSLSKLGRYKAGGKILGKGKVDAESAAKLKTLLQKKGNEIIDKLDDIIKSKLPEFPNNKKQEDFIDMCLEISKVYDGLVAATKKDPEDKEFLPVDAANEIINDLREYVKDFLDVKLAAVYSVTNESEYISEVEEETDDERLARKKGELTAKTAGTKEKIKSGELQGFDSERIKTLKSWKLPLTLLGTGISFGALSWLVKALCTDTKEITYDILKKKTEFLAAIKPGEGMTQILNRAFEAGLNPNSSPEEFLAVVKKVGGGSIDKGIELMTQEGGIFRDSEAARATLEEIAKNPNAHGDNLKEIFSGKWAGTGKSAGDTLVTVQGGNLQGIILQKVIKTATITTTKYTLAAPVLKTLGVALLAGGVAVALARWKGRKSSRAQVLNDLYQNLRPLEATKENPKVIEPKKKEDEKSTIAVTTASPENVKKTVSTISNLNRNGQIAVVLSRISPKANLYKELGKDSTSSLSDGELKKIQTNPDSSDAAKKLATLVMNVRKSPDTLLKKISNATGVKLQARAKAIATQPGTNTKAQLQTVAENILTEAMIDDVFSELGITDDVIKNNKVALIALLGSMYASEGDNKLSIVNPKEAGFSEEETKQLQDLGFSPQAGGNYVFLKTGQTKKDVTKTTTTATTQPDVDKVTKAIGADNTFKGYLSKIDNVDELANFILALFIYRDTKGDPIFGFSADDNKLRSTLSSLSSKIPSTIKEEDTTQAINKFPDVKTALTHIGRSSTLRGLLKSINTPDEFNGLIIKSILPYMNPKFKTKSGVGILKQAISKASNMSSQYKDLLTKKTNKTLKEKSLNESFIRMQKLAGIIK